MRYILYGRAVDDKGNGTIWEWTTGESGVLPNSTERSELTLLMSDYFRGVFNHNPTRTAVVALPSCGVDSPHKLARWDRNPEDGSRGLWIEED